MLRLLFLRLQFVRSPDGWIFWCHCKSTIEIQSIPPHIIITRSSITHHPFGHITNAIQPHPVHSNTSRSFDPQTVHSNTHPDHSIPRQFIRTPIPIIRSSSSSFEHPSRSFDPQTVHSNTHPSDHRSSYSSFEHSSPGSSIPIQFIRTLITLIIRSLIISSFEHSSPGSSIPIQFIRTLITLIIRSLITPIIRSLITSSFELSSPRCNQ